MTETLTESFCERCGTRYEFKAPTRLNPLRKTRGLIGGLRNYLTSQDALSDAVGDAMRSEEDGIAAAQLEAFHESFNFCIDCRQYTCVNCWNDDAGRCRSCAPIPGTDDLAERLAASFGAPVAGAAVQPGVDFSQYPGSEAWPTSDLPIAGGNGTTEHVVSGWPDVEFPIADEPAEPVAADIQPEVEPVAAADDAEPTWAAAEIDLEPVAADIEPEPVAAEVEPEPVVAEVELEPAVAEVQPEPEPVVAEAWPVAEAFEPEPVVAEAWPVEETFGPEPEPVAAGGNIEIEPVRAPLRVVAWDEDAAYELVEPEPIVAEVEPEPEPVVAEVEPEPVVAEVEPEPEPIAAAVEPEPEPILLAPISETILHFPTRPTPLPSEEEPAAAAAVDDTPELAARRAQLDLLGLGDLGEGPVGPTRPQALPYRSRGAAISEEELARAAVLRGSFWEASAREVASATGHVGVQSCGQCGLSLSANARFCRRCGTRQAQSA